MPETIGDRIRKLRINAGMSQRKFARGVYVTRSTVYRWEKGKSVPYLDMSALQNINKDITEHAELNLLGMDIDREKWLKLRSAIQKEIAFRCLGGGKD